MIICPRSIDFFPIISIVLIDKMLCITDKTVCFLNAKLEIRSSNKAIFLDYQHKKEHLDNAA